MPTSPPAVSRVAGGAGLSGLCLIGCTRPWSSLKLFSTASTLTLPPVVFPARRGLSLPSACLLGWTSLLLSITPVAGGCNDEALSFLPGHESLPGRTNACRFVYPRSRRRRAQLPWAFAAAGRVERSAACQRCQTGAGRTVLPTFPCDHAGQGLAEG